jgi:hypothetical protein
MTSFGLHFGALTKEVLNVEVSKDPLGILSLIERCPDERQMKRSIEMINLELNFGVLKSEVSTF